MASPRSLVMVELTRDELSLILVHAQTQLAELTRVQEELQDAEGESATQWSLLRRMKPQIELYADLAVKLEGAAKEAGWR